MSETESYDYTLFFRADLSKLPTEVLHSIRVAVDKEVRGRLDTNKESAHVERNVLGRFEKCVRRKFHRNYLGYLSEILNQDWAPLFDGDPERKYYVYIHIKPAKKGIRFYHDKCVINCDGVPFYVGKGTGNRAYDLNRNEGHGAILRQLRANGRTTNDIVYIVKDRLSETEALALESQLIYFFGTRFEKRVGILVNLEIPKRPEKI